jgi:hypothetical protein
MGIRALEDHQLPETKLIKEREEPTTWRRVRQ